MKLHEDITHTRTMNRFKTLEEDFRKVHSNKYDYSKVIYKRVDKKVIITCPIHGDFSQTPNNHLRGQECAKCMNKYTLSTKEFIEKAKIVHGNTYDYSKVTYTHTHTKVIITCPIHGDFSQSPGAHLQGQGCAKCKFDIRRSNTDKFIKKANDIHNNKYDYSKVIYIDSTTEVIITCPVHGDFSQTPASHLQKHGCSNCAIENNGYKRTTYKDIPTILYYLRVERENYYITYKIGITRKSVNERYKQELSNCKITTLKETLYEDGVLAWDEELRIKREFKDFKYNGDRIFDNTGTTELFVKDVLELDGLYSTNA